MRRPVESTNIYNDLRTKITNGEIKSGEYLVEADLSARYKVSRTPVRQALRVLEDDGLVKIIPCKGTYVKYLSVEDVVEVYQTIEALEGMAVFLLCKKTDRNLDQLHTLNIEMKKMLEQGDIVAWCNLDEELHELLYTMCGNSVIAQLYNILKPNMRRVRTFYSSIWHDKEYSCSEHDVLLDYIHQGDAENARSTIQNHYRMVLNHAASTLGLERGENQAESIPLKTTLE